MRKLEQTIRAFVERVEKVKWKKLAAGAALTAGAYVGIGNYFYNLAMKRGDKFFLQDNPSLPGGTSGTNAENAERKQKVKAWASHALKEQVNMTSFDGLKLSGTIFLQEEKSHQWMILVHGYMTDAQSMIDFAYDYYSYGFNLLVIDCRASGKSEGSYTSMGWFEHLDLAAWCWQLANRDPQSEIALFGISMGGATVMMASGEKLPGNVKCIIEDCGYTSVEDILAFQLKNIFHLPKFPFINACDQVAKVRGGWSIRKASAVDQLKKNKLPMLFIHGDQDDFVPFAMLDEVYQACNAPKEKLVIPGAAHALAFEVDGEKYLDTVMRFIVKHMM